MLDILSPHFRVAMTLAEYQEGLGAEYPEKYIIQPDGTIMKRIELSHGRFIQYKVDKLPDRGGDKLPLLKEEIAFLPAGKVPVIMLHQIVDFFKRVMTDMGGDKVKSHGALEAMAHIVWNPTQDATRYQIRIPTQVVSAARVSYKFDHLDKGDQIIVDIHSHNNMGAFFSGTDDSDDRKNTCYSGVVGKLGTGNPETKWRFNDLNHKKFDCALSDIFVADTAECPKEWFDKVSRYTYQAPSYTQGGGKNQGKGKTGNQKNNQNNVRKFPNKNLNLPSGGKAKGGNPDALGNLHAAQGYEDDINNQFGQMSWLEDEDSWFEQYGVSAQEIKEMEKAGMEKSEIAQIYAGVKTQAADESEEELIERVIASGDVPLANIFHIIPRFHGTPKEPTGEMVWIDKYSEDENGEFDIIEDSKIDEYMEEVGKFMMYIPITGTYISSPDIEEKTSPKLLLEIYRSANFTEEGGNGFATRLEELEAEEDMELEAALDLVENETLKADLMNFLKVGTSKLDKLLITAYLFKLHVEGKLQPRAHEEEEDENVSVH